MDEDGRGWTRMDEDGRGWTRTRMDSDGLGWTRMDSDGLPADSLLDCASSAPSVVAVATQGLPECRRTKDVPPDHLFALPPH
jgi:hypothetical protein